MKVVAVFALVALCVIAVSGARKCYQCDDETTPTCSDLNDSHSTKCVDADKNCFKYGETDKRKHGCTDTDEKTFCDDTKKECSVCTDEDNCNSSSSVMASAILVATSAIFLKMR